MLKKIYSNLETLDTKLSIVIPTFNRIENLKLLLNSISKEQLKDIELIILDNKSENLISKSFLQEKFIDCKLIYYQNSIHISGDSNILRAYEVANSNWIYVIGDSKIPKTNFILDILKDISEHKNLNTIIYKFASNYKEDMIINDIEKLSLKKIHFGDFFLVGTSVVSKQAINDYYKYAIGICFTHLPHSIFHLYSIVFNKNVLFKKNKILKKFLNKPSYYNPALTYLECLGFFPIIDSLFYKKSIRKLIYKGTLSVTGETWRISYHCLKFLFKKRIDITSHLERILNYRYNFFTLKVLYEMPLIYLFLILGKFLKLIKYIN